MKRVLCLLLCMMLAVSFAMAETADTLPKKFARQLTGGNGVRGYISITASGLADWLNALLPFTATNIQIRAIGEKQGEMSESIVDDDDWQIKLYAENSADEAVGTTWIYGNPEGIYFQSELLPGAVLSLPMEQVHLLYEIFRGEWTDLFFSFDPMGMKEPGANGNVSAYTAVAEMLGIPADEWETEWLPVLENYFLQLDLWLASYGDPSFVTGEEAGSLKMNATYTIPAEDVKAEAKYLIAQMLYDNDLQTLLLPYVTLEQRTIYLNQSMVYFYNACIDALELTGDVVLSREMSALGEVVSTTVSLPLPPLPDTLTDPVGEAVAALFELENKELFTGMDRLTLTQSGAEKSIVLSGEKRTITIAATETAPDEYTTAWDGTLTVIPSGEEDESAIAAAFTGSTSHKIWQDEKYLDHETSEFAIAIEPDLDMLEEDDPLRSYCLDFQPLSLKATVDYRNDPNKANSAVQINLNLDAQLPDADVQAEAVLRITTKTAMEMLPTQGAEDFTQLTEERKDELFQQLLTNAVQTMANLSVPVAEETAQPDAEATVVPPMTEE